MNISPISKITTETVHVSWTTDDEGVYPFKSYYFGYDKARLGYVILEKTTTGSGDVKYSYSGVAFSPYKTARFTDDSVYFKDGDFTVIRRLFDDLGWEFPENPHIGKEGWY